MPEMEQKTPLYDLLVWFVNSPEPVVVMKRKRWEEVEKAQNNFHNASPRYNSTYSVDLAKFNANHVVRTEIKRSTKEIVIPYDGPSHLLHFPQCETVEVWEEDEND